MYSHAYAGQTVPRQPTSHPILCPYGAHRAKDGQVIFGIQNEREWAAFCSRVLGRPEVQTDPRFNTVNGRRDNREALTALIEDFFAGMTSMQVVEALEAAGIANGRLNESKDIWEHAQLAARDKWREVMTPNGPVRALLPPFVFGDGEAFVGDVPALGQHTDQVLAELGYDAAAIAGLRAGGAI